VVAAEADLHAAEANVQLQRALRYPDPTVSLEVEHNPPGGGPALNTAGIGLSFPLPIWNRNRGAIHAAEATADQLRVARDKARSQVIADIASAEAGYREANARWLRYRDDLAPKSASVREAVAYAYEKGGASLLNLLDAERTDNDIRLATAQAVADQASAAADLAAARAVISANEVSASQ